MVFISRPIRSPYSPGSPYPTVSGRLIVVAPAAMTASMIRHRKSNSERLASSQENSTSSVYRRACVTERMAWSTTWSGVICSLYCMWIGEVAMKVWIRGRTALFRASAARSMSL